VGKGRGEDRGEGEAGAEGGGVRRRGGKGGGGRLLLQSIHHLVSKLAPLLCEWDAFNTATYLEKGLLLLFD
jgi:hypothetical protein